MQGSDVVLGLRSEMKRGSWVRVTAKAAGIPVYALKVGRVSHLLKALETVLGLQPSPGGVFDSGSGSDEEPVQYQNHVVSMVSHLLCQLCTSFLRPTFHRMYAREGAGSEHPSARMELTCVDAVRRR